VIGIGVFLAFCSKWSRLERVIYYGCRYVSGCRIQSQQMMLNIVVIGGVWYFSVLHHFIHSRIALEDKKVNWLIGIRIRFKVVGGWSIVLLVLGRMWYHSCALTLVVLSEIFPTRIRGAAIRLERLAHWGGNFTLTYSIPTIKANLGWAHNFLAFMG